MNSDWIENARKLHQHIVGGKWEVNSPEDQRFLTLALVGEAGELANFVKKRWRGDVVAFADIRKELADIRIYLELLADTFGCDLDAECVAKMAEVKARYGQ